MFGSGLSFGYATQASQPEPSQTQRAPRQEEKQTCVPVTVRVLQDSLAARADPDAELQIHGSEFGSVVLVGVVEDLVQQPTVVEFCLNDASGRVKVRQFDSTVEGLTNGRYVSVVGSVRTAPAVHVSAMVLRLVESADEVSYHMIETAHAALKMRNGGSAALKPMAQTEMTPASKQRADLPTPTKEVADVPMMPAEVAAPPAAAAAPTQTQPTKIMELHGVHLRAAVVKVLETGDPSTGLNISMVHEKIQIQGTATLEQVKETVSKLVDEGEAFNTIDDEHFQLL
mmetsp:Transcript_104650/g.191078  ORF Transcript_104650/g.191078 Transcript_104650/m.191078 type:complete len:285 (+) Transcript_104650:105-959(+)